MNVYFYANQEDFREVLEFIFKKTDLRVFDSYSEYGQEMKEYFNAGEIDISNRLGLAFWKKEFSQNFNIEKIDLDPKRCKGFTHRYKITGWGVIFLDGNNVEGNILRNSRFGVNTLKRALLWQLNYPEMGDPNLWDWAEIEKTMRKIKYGLSSKMSKNAINRSPVLSKANELFERNVQFI